MTMKVKPELLKNLNYLNMKEIDSLCKKYKIPVSIMLETPTGYKKSKDKDRKGVILDRIRKFLKTGMISNPTVYQSKICSDSPLANLRSTSKLHYGQYDKYNEELIGLLQKLTDGKFKDGFIARELLRNFWVLGKAPSLKEFSLAWLKAVKNYKKDHTEWAFLTDLSKGEGMEDWKKKRNDIAKAVLKELERW